MTPLVLLTACNTAPVDYRDLGTAPGAEAPWGAPSEGVCADRVPRPEDEVIDGYTLCAENQLLEIVPIDDPIYVPCEEAALIGEVVYVFDGVRARGYSKSFLDDRELVHDEWGGVPVLVDH